MRYDIVSDTHGYLSEELLGLLDGADAIVHAGDICSTMDYEVLSQIAPVHACLGNNDWDPYAYPPDVKDFVRFFSSGLRWQICHYERKLDPTTADIAICGHSHRPFVRRDPATGCLMMNPGSPTWPRGGFPSIGRILVDDGHITSAEILKLETDGRRW